MDFQDQGTYVDCVYCKYIKPKMKNRSQCPKCGGKTPEFRNARMMDKYSSEQHILNKMIEIFGIMGSKSLTNEEMQDQLLRILTEIDIYGFDCKQAIINRIRDFSA